MEGAPERVGDPASAAELMSPVPDPQCPNCGSLAKGKYCPECGQRQGELRPSVRWHLEDVARYLLRVDSRYPLTLRGLFVPGFLTEEYFRGRRERYEKP